MPKLTFLSIVMLIEFKDDRVFVHGNHMHCTCRAQKLSKFAIFKIKNYDGLWWVVTDSMTKLMGLQMNSSGIVFVISRLSLNLPSM